MRFNLLSLLAIIATCESAISREAGSSRDNAIAKNWPDNFERVEILSSVDNEIQQAIFFRSQLATPQPLIVSLHSWSGDYLQADLLAEEIVETKNLNRSNYETFNDLYSRCYFGCHVFFV